MPYPLRQWYDFTSVSQHLIVYFNYARLSKTMVLLNVLAKIFTCLFYLSHIITRTMFGRIVTLAVEYHPYDNGCHLKVTDPDFDPKVT